VETSEFESETAECKSTMIASFNKPPNYFVQPTGVEPAFHP
jgi:hypothetical protein